MEPTRILIVVRGGLVQYVAANDASVQICILDFDDMDAEKEDENFSRKRSWDAPDEILEDINAAKERLEKEG
jgi:hypothetical protein